MEQELAQAKGLPAERALAAGAALGLPAPAAVRHLGSAAAPCGYEGRAAKRFARTHLVISSDTMARNAQAN